MGQCHVSAVTCEWLILCQAVEQVPNRGDSLIRLFGRAMIEEVPGVVDPLVAAFRIRGAPAKAFTVSIEVFEPDGSSLLGTPTLAHRIPRLGAWDGSFTLGPLQLPTFGVYRVVLNINGVASTTTVLTVEQFVH